MYLNVLLLLSTSMTAARSALSLKIVSECSVTKARCCKMTLPHHTVDTPVFMPVGTQGTLKGITPDQLEELNCQIILGNTYHLGHRPVSKATKDRFKRAIARLARLMCGYDWSFELVQLSPISLHDCRLQI